MRLWMLNFYLILRSFPLLWQAPSHSELFIFVICLLIFFILSNFIHEHNKNDHIYSPFSPLTFLLPLLTYPFPTFITC